MFIIDSSIFCACFLDEDTNHERAKVLLWEIEERILVPYIVLSEVLTVLTYKHSKDRANEFADFILSDNRFILIDADMTSEVYFWKSIDNNLSYIDIVLTYVALRNDATLLTFDDAMIKFYQKIRENKS